MNKKESKYFGTAEKMDEAFLELLGKKDFDYITVKEICEKALVNRSTFYLHYETVSDLLAESVEYLNRNFLSSMKVETKSFISEIKTCPLEELYLITPEYLNPYLEYIKENKKIFSIALENAATLQLNKSYSGLFRYIIGPILERYKVPECKREYMISFYISGIMAVIKKWISDGYSDSIDFITNVITDCVKKPL